MPKKANKNKTAPYVNHFNRIFACLFHKDIFDSLIWYLLESRKLLSTETTGELVVLAVSNLSRMVHILHFK